MQQENLICLLFIVSGFAVDKCGECNTHVDFDSVMPLQTPGIKIVPGYVSLFVFLWGPLNIHFAWT